MSMIVVQNILKSDDRRLTKRVIKEQKEEDEDDDTIYRTTKDHLDKYGININEIANMEKSKLKKLLKDKINEEMKKMVEKAAGNMTKLRFIKVDNFERQKYIYELKGHECIQAIKTRLNMLPIYGNYKSNLTLNKMCRYCNQQEDTTEHTIECTELGQSLIKREDLENTDNIQLWRMINERTNFNIDNRSEI